MNFKTSGRSRRVESVIDITALVDVVFLLIIFLLITTTFKKKEHAFALDLPTATEKELIVTVQEDQPTVYITQKGEYYLLEVPGDGAADAEAPSGAETLTEGQLEERLRALAERSPDAELSVKAQDSTPYQNFIDVMNLCRRVGIRNVMLPYDLIQPGGATGGADSRDKPGPAPGSDPGSGPGED